MGLRPSEQRQIVKMMQQIGGSQRGAALVNDRRATPRPQRRSPVNIQIEELVLHGFPYHERHRIAQAVERELGRLLRNGQPESLRRCCAAERIDGGSFKVTAGWGAIKTGREIARALYRGLQQDGK